jgi:hypothetical protein
MLAPSPALSPAPSPAPNPEPDESSQPDISAPDPKAAAPIAAAPINEPSKVVAGSEEETVDEADQARYDELSAKFRESPSNLKPEELPEFFTLCSKLKVSPT